MIRRRWIALALLVAIAVTIAPQSSRAQIPMIAQGIIHATVASVNVANTTALTLLYQYPIPAALLATWTTNNTAFGAAPLHLRLNGTIRTLGTVGGPTNNNLTVTLGSTAPIASMMVVNGGILPPDLGAGNNCAGIAVANACFAPFTLDVMISPIATLTSTSDVDLRGASGGGKPSVYMTARLSVASTTLGQNPAFIGATTETTYNAATLAAVNLSGATSFPLNVNFQWGTAASGNSLNIYNGVLKLGF